MKSFHFKKLWTEQGWKENVSISINSKGFITSFKESGRDLTGKEITINLAIPGIPNAHSHAFQYAMVGLAEKHPIGKDSDFWSWRKAMYDLALTVNPDQLRHIATFLYSEMVRNGYTHVAEFHYLHHDHNGNKYSNHAEMGMQLLEAAKLAGINITLIPMCYQMGGFNQPPLNQQKRFLSRNINDYLDLFEKTRSLCKTHNQHVGIGIHSIRAVHQENIIQINEYNNNVHPYHMHISEQKKEVDNSLKSLGKRPVEWLSEQINLNHSHHLVHATHVSTKEINLLCKSKVNVILCPTTEGNLADGLFPFPSYQENIGRWCIGSDSHVSVNPFDEIRILDYGQRLISNKRNTFHQDNLAQFSSAEVALHHAILNGNSAVGIEIEKYFELDYPLNFIQLDHNHPLLSQTNKSQLLDTVVYGSGSEYIMDTFVNGENHSQKLSSNTMIQKDFIKTLEELKNRN